MKPEEQRIAIAEACGWTWCNHPDFLGTALWGWSINKAFHDEDYYRCEKLLAAKILPDYLNDLNAMHEAEKLIRSKLNKRNGQVYAYLYESELNNLTGGEPIYATAAQRAEAFLKTIGQWND